MGDVKQLVDEIDNAFIQGPIDEVGITLDPNLPQVVLVDGKLGLAKSCLKPLFKHAMVQLYSLRDSYKYDLTNSNLAQSILSISRIVLLIKGDFPVAYELRKQLVLNGQCSVREEIPFSSLVFTQHPKCPSGWQHRRWCMQIKNGNSVGPLRMPGSEIETERELCRIMAEKHPKNYYAWLHRLWLLQFMTCYQLEDELLFTARWLHSHVSDHSAVNHRMQVLRHIMSQPNTLRHVLHGEQGEPEDSEGNNREGSDSITGAGIRKELLEKMLKESEEQLTSRPGHESLWYLRRGLAETLLTEYCRDAAGPVVEQAIQTGGTQSDVPSKRPAGSQLSEETLSWLRGFFAAETALVAKCCNEEATAWDGAAQKRIALRYKGFLVERIVWYFGSSVI